jgi:hypothetical protein
VVQGFLGTLQSSPITPLLLFTASHAADELPCSLAQFPPRRLNRHVRAPLANTNHSVRHPILKKSGCSDDIQVYTLPKLTSRLQTVGGCKLTPAYIPNCPVAFRTES